MLHLVRSVGSIFLGSGLVMMGNGLLGTVVSLRVGEEGFSALTAGLVLSAYYLGFTLGALTITPLVRRVGHIRVFAAMAAMACAAVLLMALVPHPATWFPLRAVIGFAMVGVFVVIESWLNARITHETRGALLALYMLVVQLALGGGQLLVPLYPPSGVELFVVIAVLYALALIPVALTTIAQPVLPELSHVGLREIVRTASLGLAGCAIAGVVTSALLTLGPLYVIGAGHSIEDAAVFMGSAVVGGLLLQWPLGRLSDRVGRRPVLIAVCTALAGVASLLYLFDDRTMMTLIVAAAVVGALAFVIYPLALAHANDLIDPDSAVAASGSLLLAFGVGAAVGPLVGVGWMSLLGVQGLFAWIGSASGLLTLVTGYRLLRRRLPDIERAAYLPVSMPQTMPGGQLDPRTDAAD